MRSNDEGIDAQLRAAQLTKHSPVIILPQGVLLPSGTDYHLFLNRDVPYYDLRDEDNPKPLHTLLVPETRSFCDLIYVTCNASQTTIVGRCQLVETMDPTYLSLRIREIERHQPEKASEKCPGQSPSKPLRAFSNKKVIERIITLIQGSDSSEPLGDGALIVTAATKSGKTQILTGLVSDLVKKIKSTNPGKKPHIVTIEEGFEGPLSLAANDKKGQTNDGKSHKWFNDDGSINPPYTDPSALHEQFGVSLTSRRVPQEVPTVNQGLIDALRQTPDIVYLGELREHPAIQSFDEFCGTGHRGAATMHAASLQEQLDRYMTVIGAVAPRERERAARRLRAVIHLTRIEGKLQVPPHVDAEPPAHGQQGERAEGDVAYEAILVAMWWQIASSVRGLAEGEQLLPHSQPEEHGCCGRFTFITPLLENLIDTINAHAEGKGWNAGQIRKLRDLLANELKRHALKEDLYKGL